MYDTVTGQLATETDELGNTTSYAYDAYGRVKSITLPDPDGAGPLASPIWGYVWCACGSLKTITDPLGNTTTYDYDSVTGLLETVTSADPDGAGPLTPLVTTYAYDALGRLTSETGPGSRVTSYTYDGNGNLLTVTLPDPDDTGPLTAPVTTYAYDALGRLTGVTDALGQTTTYQYDTRNRVTQIARPDPDGAGPQAAPMTRYAYDAAGNVLTGTDPLNRIANYGYDALGRVTTVTVPAIQFDFGTINSPTAAGFTPVAHNTTYNAARGYGWLSGSIISADRGAGTDLTRDFNGTTNGTFVADLPNGTYEVTITLGDLPYLRDDMGIELEGTLIDTVTAPAGQPVTETYTVTVSDGQLTFRLHDLGGSNTLSVVNALQIVSTSTPIATYTTEYDALGRVISETDPLGNVTSYEYDVNGFLVKRTDPDPDGAGPLSSPVTQWGYDDAGRLTSMTDPLGQVTTYAYDNLGRRTSVTLPDPDGAGPQTAAVYTTTYDAAGDVLTRTDPLGNVTTYEYDDLHRLIVVTDPELGQTTYAYDAVGDLISLTDPVGNVTTWTYDNLGRVTAETNDLSDTRSWTYDAAGNVLTATDRNGRVIEYDYDNLQRLVQELWKQSSTTLNTIDYTYDAASQLTAIADDFSAYAYTYDGLGRVTQVDNAGTSVGPHVVFHSTYNAAGWRTSNRAVVDSTDDFINTYGYDNLGRMTHVQQVEPASGNSVAEKRVDFAYNAAGRFESITRWMDITQTVLVAATTFTYDDAHRLTGLSHDQGLTNLAGYAWTYDTAGRLTSVTTVDGTDAYAYDDTGQLTGVDSDYQTDEAYTYDANGNRTNTGYSTGDNNRLLSDGTYNYEYDAEGNRTKKTEISTGDYVEYTWDHRNRLTSVTFRNSSDAKLKEVTYVYDVFDRRIAKDVDDDGNGSIDRGERYVYDGSDIALVYDESDLLVERLLYGPGVDQPLASEDAGGDVLWFLTDNQGTVRDVAEHDAVSGDTSVVNHLTYGGFGNITAQSNASLEPRHTYTGREWDADSELFYYRARWYDPVAGRFITEDPIGFSAWDANLSRYVGNSAPNATDPSGQFQWNVVGAWFTGFGQGLAQGAANLGNAFYEPFKNIGATGQAIGNSAVAYAEQFGDGSFDGGANDWGWFAAGFTSEVTGISALDEIGQALGDRAVAFAEHFGDGSFEGGWNDWGMFAAGLAGEIAGLNKLYEAFSGKDLATCEALSLAERIQRGLTGLVQAALVGAAIKQQLAKPAPNGIKANKAAGDAWEKELLSTELPKTQGQIQPQITVKSNGPSGKKARLDAVGTETSSGKVKLTDGKASASAPLTKNQKVVYPELEVYGGTVVGKGKPPYVGGTAIPPTKVDIIVKH